MPMVGTRAMAPRRTIAGAIPCVAAAVLFAIAVPGVARASDGDPSGEPAAHSAEPMKLVVSLSEQRVDVYRGLVKIDSAPVSSGRPNHPTPAGVYSILQKRRWHRSNIYSQAPMPFMQRITWSGMALHAGHLPGYPASHGCIRLPPSFAEKLWGMTEIGVDVIVAEGAPVPEPIEHEALFQPAPPRLYTEASLEPSEGAGVEPAEAPAYLADVEGDVDRLTAYRERSRAPLRILITRLTGRERMKDVQSLLAELGHNPGEIDGYLGRDTVGAIQSLQRAAELAPTGMVTEDLIDVLHAMVGRERTFGHLYVRQNYVDQFDAPVVLTDPGTPLGTHIYTALNFEDGATATEWSALTLTEDGPTSAAQALDRFVIPDDIRERISSLMTPGTTVVISDSGRGRETGRGTDFIVQPR